MVNSIAPYSTAEIEIVSFDSSDIVTASGGILSNDQNSTYDDGGWT